jgi:hypothetical protein
MSSCIDSQHLGARAAPDCSTASGHPQTTSSMTRIQAVSAKPPPFVSIFFSSGEPVVSRAGRHVDATCYPTRYPTRSRRPHHVGLTVAVNYCRFGNHEWEANRLAWKRVCISRQLVEENSWIRKQFPSDSLTKSPIVAFGEFANRCEGCFKQK